MVKIMHQEGTLANFAENNQAIFKGRLVTWQKKKKKEYGKNHPSIVIILK